jgi:hypothetical protein
MFKRSLFFIAVLFCFKVVAQPLTLMEGTKLYFTVKMDGETKQMKFGINYFNDSVSYDRYYNAPKKGSEKSMEVWVSQDKLENSLLFWIDCEEWVNQYENALDGTPGLWSSKRNYSMQVALLNDKKDPSYSVTNATYSCTVKGKRVNLKCLKIVNQSTPGEDGVLYETYLLKDEKNPLLLKSTTYEVSKTGKKKELRSYALTQVTL